MSVGPNQPWTKYLPASLRAKLDGRGYLQKVVSNTGWQFADNVLRMGGGFVVGIWVLRYLGPDNYGQLSYALALAALFLPFASLGLEEILVRNLTLDPVSKDEVLGTAFVLKFAGSLVAFLLPVACAFWAGSGSRAETWLVAVIALGSVFQPFRVAESWFNSQVRAKYVALARTSAFVICSAARILLILTGGTLLSFAAVFALEAALGAVGLVVAYRSKGGSLVRVRFSAGCARSLLRDSWPLFFTNVSVILYQRVDQIMLMQMVGSRELGVYSAAVRFTEVWAFVPTILFWSVFPSILEAKGESEELFYKRLQSFYNLMAFVSYTIALPTAVCSRWLVDWLLGGGYAGAAVMIATLIWANLFWNLEMARCAFLTAMNWTRYYFVTVLLACVLNVALNWVMIPRYGGMGAVLASLFAYWFAAHGSCFLFRPLFRTGRMLTRAMVCPRIG